MISAHVESLLALGEPFRHQNAICGRYPFADQTITDRIRKTIPTILRNRLVPPPKETYSLNRKLSGAFLLLSRLGSRVDCVGVLDEVVGERGRWRGEGGEREKRLAPLGPAPTPPG